MSAFSYVSYTQLSIETESDYASPGIHCLAIQNFHFHFEHSIASRQLRDLIATQYKPS